MSLLPALPATLTPLSLLLQAKESIEQLVYLCQTDKEPVREAAKQSLMLCGECLTASLCSFPTHGILSAISCGSGGPGLVPAYTVHSSSLCPKLCWGRASWQRAARAKHPVATEH